MNVFILCTGRCGSTTFIEACYRITNYTAAHESNRAALGSKRLQYPDRHIEADNRLAWYLGGLERLYGDDAFYVHMKRDDYQTAVSYAQRRPPSRLMEAYLKGILIGYDYDPKASDVQAALDLVHTVNANIEAFLVNKSNKMNFPLEQADYAFGEFWDRIRAEGDFDAARQQWRRKYNQAAAIPPRPILYRLVKKGNRVIRGLPQYIREA